MTVIARSDDLRRENQRRIFAALRAESVLSRTELSTATGLSASTVTAITSALMEGGYLTEAAKPASLLSDAGVLTRRGRPQVALTLNPKAATIAALALTLNRMSAAVIDYSGKVIAEATERPDTLALDREALAAGLAALLDRALAEAGRDRHALDHITVAVQGMTDAQGVRMKWSPITPHRDIDIAVTLETAFGAPVSVSNDCNMIAAALRQREPERYRESFAAILLSHGIGMGLFLHGSLFTGLWSSAAEFGHMCHIPDGALCRCGRHGCIEAYAADYGIWRMATGHDPMVMPCEEINDRTMAQIAERARAGEAASLAAFRSAGAALGHGLRSLFALLDPFPVAFVGAGVLALDLMEPAIRKSLGREGIGLSHGDAEIASYADELELLREGSIATALNALDRTIHAGRDGGDTGQDS